MNLKLTTAEGVSERRVRGGDFSIRTGLGEPRRWRVKDIERVEVELGFDDERAVCYVGRVNGGAEYVILPRGSTIALDEQTFRADELIEFVLAEEPKPVELPRPYAPGTYRLHRFDGSTELVEQVERIEDMSTWTIREAGAMPQPPEAVTT